ncbi:glycosyltransferase family 2 protein [Microbacterium sp. ASV49]|uniref:Glycosyltransferase n=1 Tax=Microbacterium candidum TaxID=3041922 RepID=A0ABT7MUY7_9MICO|nr:glycosyltransferase [Microbacterium sp. ASV49]MDL9978259.1 glycosyltransferase [Microbacterium sp. ASV49]
MSDAPSVSVIVPLHNGAGFIVETISCVLGQTHPDIEVLIVDDGSTDDGLDRVRPLRRDPRVSVAAKRWSGIADTRNAGLSLVDAASSYVLFLDQDDIIAPDLIETLFVLLSTHPEAVAAYAIADFIDADGRPLHPGAFAGGMRTRRTAVEGALRAIAPDSPATFCELFVSNPIYPPSGILIRKAALLEIGGFDPSYRVADDWDALVRLARLGPLIPLDEIKVGYRRHGANASGNTPLNVRETRAVWANTYYDPMNSREQRGALRDAWRALQRDKAMTKSEAAKASLRSGAPGRAMSQAVDALAHRVLFAPLRAWRTRNGSSMSLVVRAPAVTLPD